MTNQGIRYFGLNKVSNWHIKYHLGKSHELGVNTKEMYEVFAVANIVGGTIVVPHTRRAAEYWEALVEN